MTYRRLLFAFGLLAVTAAVSFAQAPSADEDVARRQLESGRAFVRQGNYTEAMKDFRAVADSHPTSSVADNALLEIARYYLDVAGDMNEAMTAVDSLLKKYPTADAAPDGYVMMGRLALARGHQPAELETALANFDRVTRLFPDSDAVPASLVLAAEAYVYQGRLNEARANLARVQSEYPRSSAAAEAYLAAGRVLLAQGDPIAAMEELQQVRNHWPSTPNAAAALGRLTILHRLYVRGRGGAPFAASTEQPGPVRLAKVSTLAVTDRNVVYWAGETGFAGVSTAPGGGGAAPLPPAPRARGMTRDAAGALYTIEPGGLKPATGPIVPILVPRSNGLKEPLAKIEAAAQLSTGDWLIADEDERAIYRFSRTGEFIGIFAPVRVSRLAITAGDEIAGIDRDQKSIVLLDVAGKVLGRIPTKTTAYDVENAVDLAFDAFGHLYVLGRGALAVFTPYRSAASAPAAGGRGTATPTTAAGRAYDLLVTYSEPERNPGAFARATAFALDASGGMYLYDERAQRIRVYR
jgi:TolA-binding protein